MTALLALVLANLDVLFAALMATHGLALVVVNLTATPADNAFVSKFYRVVEVVAGVITPAAKQVAPGK